jgi:5-bromo-4-chloroindolyl phosphate hydrolysis protein
MGLFWDLVQHGQISRQQLRSDSMELKVERLERELQDTRALLQTLLERLEKHFGEDINRDGRVG